MSLIEPLDVSSVWEHIDDFELNSMTDNVYDANISLQIHLISVSEERIDSIGRSQHY